LPLGKAGPGLHDRVLCNEQAMNPATFSLNQLPSYLRKNAEVAFAVEGKLTAPLKRKGLFE
jgi:hypothetical protein